MWIRHLVFLLYVLGVVDAVDVKRAMVCMLGLESACGLQLPNPGAPLGGSYPSASGALQAQGPSLGLQAGVGVGSLPPAQEVHIFKRALIDTHRAEDVLGTLQGPGPGH